MDTHLEETPLMDTSHPDLVTLVRARGWQDLPTYEAVGAIYDFVRNEIRFGYNASDDLPASSVLADGYGQCNTKGTLLMALLRAAEVPCRDSPRGCRSRHCYSLSLCRSKPHRCARLARRRRPSQ